MVFQRKTLLLSLIHIFSVGAFVGGIGGLIVALPITTLAMAYYKRYVVKEPDVDLPCGETP